jgi:hypothetical protein
MRQRSSILATVLPLFFMTLAACGSSEPGHDSKGLPDAPDAATLPDQVVPDHAVPDAPTSEQDGNAPDAREDAALPTPDAGTTLDCSDRLAPGLCNECFEQNCCEEILACDEHPTCWTCVDGTNEAACQTAETEALKACAGVGGACVEACMLAVSCEDTLIGACGRCVAANCCEEVAACASREGCWSCLGNSTEDCWGQTDYENVWGCAESACWDECLGTYCSEIGQYCESGSDCCNGTCTNHQCATCVPDCDGKQCGANGCGGNCGTCPGNATCQGGQCVCEPNCYGKDCGDDGCGGTCGTCSGGNPCISGNCCAPTCDGKECGSDGCGGSCGICGSGDVCQGGSCCTPTCGGKECGSNGCGGTCGTCSSGENCESGQCVADPNDCDPVYNSGCSYPNQCILLSNESTACALAGNGTQGDYCSSTTPCAGGHSCFAGTCRKICDKYSGEGCSGMTTCQGVSGWTQFGACG